MKKVAVLLANGFEEIEALTVVDVIRRAGEICHMVSIEEEIVVGTHNIEVKADKIISDDIKSYDMIVLPGGMPGSTNLRDNLKVIELIKYFNEKNKYIGAICAAPIILEKANIIDGKNITSYPGVQDDLKSCNYVSEHRVVVDGNIITSRGPATALEFSYRLLDKLGSDKSDKLRESMMYNFLMDKER